MRVTKGFGVDHPDGVGDQGNAMDVFDIAQSERIQLDQLSIGFDAKLVQTRQMTKGMRSNGDESSVDNRHLSKMMKTLEKKRGDRWAMEEEILLGSRRSSRVSVRDCEEDRNEGSIVWKKSSYHWSIAKNGVIEWSSLNNCNRSCSDEHKCNRSAFWRDADNCCSASDRREGEGEGSNWSEWRRRCDIDWKRNEVNRTYETDRCWTYVINHVYLPVIEHESVDPNRKRLNKYRWWILSNKWCHK